MVTSSEGSIQDVDTMIDDYEDIFTDESDETIETLGHEDSKINASEGKDGCQFYFLSDGKFHEKSLPTKIKTKEDFKELVDSVFKLGVTLKKSMYEVPTSSGNPEQFFPFFSLLKKDSKVIHGTMLPNNEYSYESLRAYLGENNKENINLKDISRILHMIEVKSHACKKPTIEECRCSQSTYKNQLLIQSYNLAKPEKSLTFAMDFSYTEDGVVFDENNIQVMPMEKSVHTGRWDDKIYDAKDLPYN